MSRPDLCNYSLVGRLSKFVCHLVVFGALNNHLNANEAKRFIVRLKSQENLHPFLRPFARANSLKELTAHVNNNSQVKATALNHVNVMLAEGTQEEVEAAVADDDSVAFIEEDQEIRLAVADSNLNNNPSELHYSPYLSVMGLDAAAPAHNVTKPSGAQAMLVAVIDTGINLDHPFLIPFLSTNSGEIEGNNIDDDGNGYKDDFYGANVAGMNGDVGEVNYHGTHVAGLVKVVRDQAIAKGYSAARNIQVLPIRFFSTCGASICGSTSGAILALNYALSRGAQVINMSWGSAGYSQALYQTLVDLYSHDIVLIAAAGNDEMDTDSSTFFPSSHSTSIPGLISVNSITTYHNADGSLDDPNAIVLSSFSNFGKNSVDVAAPGSNLLSANGDVDSYPTQKFIRLSGTSMAAPLVAGVAGVMRAMNPGLTAYDVKQLITQNAEVPMDGSVKALANQNRTDGFAHAVNAFNAAGEAVGTGLLPAASSSGYSAQSNEGSSAAAAGCGSVSPGSNGGNPFGGNSMGLLFALFFLLKICGAIRKKNAL